MKLQEKLRATGVECELVHTASTEIRHADERAFLIEKLTATP